MCNCSNTTSLCNRCSQGLMCQCPPDYTVLPLPVDCGGCCPDGYTFQGPTANYPNGYCSGPGGTITLPVECNPCVDSVPAKCVILPNIPCFGITAGTTLYEFITNFMCSDAFVMSMLNRISLSTDLKTALCAINITCPAPTSGTPVMGSGSVSVP